MTNSVEKVCLLIGNKKLSSWAEEALQLVESETSASVNLVVRTYKPDKKPDQTSDFPFDAPVVYAERIPVKEKYGVRIESDIVERIARESDVVFQWANGILRGNILTEPEFGVLSYHHADFRKYRGSMRGFWQWIDDADTAGATVQQLTDDIDAGPIYAFKKVDLSRARGWSEISHLLLEAGIPLLSEAIQNMNDPEFEPTVLSESELGPVYTQNDITLPAIAKYSIKTFIYLNHRIYKNTRNLVGRYIKNYK